MSDRPMRAGWKPWTSGNASKRESGDFRMDCIQRSPLWWKWSVKAGVFTFCAGDAVDEQPAQLAAEKALEAPCRALLTDLENSQHMKACTYCQKEHDERVMCSAYALAKFSKSDQETGGCIHCGAKDHYYTSPINCAAHKF